MTGECLQCFKVIVKEINITMGNIRLYRSLTPGLKEEEQLPAFHTVTGKSHSTDIRYFYTQTGLLGLTCLLHCYYTFT